MITLTLYQRAYNLVKKTGKSPVFFTYTVTTYIFYKNIAIKVQNPEFDTYTTNEID